MGRFPKQKSRSKVFLHRVVLKAILDFQRSRDQKQGPAFLPWNIGFMRWFPVVFLTNGVFIVTHGGIELTTPVL